ncbi:MAG: hypothetical protein GY903_07195 [Fuerstiella sp.]|nr:hypothetical protein [Fuerstiella sp.]MCP4854262.1 hypothetical protein [Fuerstiella sp.]
MKAAKGKVKKRAGIVEQSDLRAAEATVPGPLLNCGGSLSPGTAFRSWGDFWFCATDPVGLHAIRVLAGILFLAWLLPFAGQLDGLFGLHGWFDQQAYREAGRLPEGLRPQFGWSALFLCGSNPMLLKAAYGVSLVVLALFSLGIATRLTAVLTWVIVVSFSANPATSYDADALLVILAFYLMIGYVFLGQSSRGQGYGNQSLRSRLLGHKETWLFYTARSGKSAESRPHSVAANVAVRLLQVHLAIVIVTSGLHKLQFGDWWAGVAFWYPLYPPLATTIEDAREHIADRIPFLVLLSLAAYATLCWQIAFPLFAWKRYWRKLLLAGAVAGWLGTTLLYQLPLFGPTIFIGCLSYLSPSEWRRVCNRLARIPPFAAASHE